LNGKTYKATTNKNGVASVTIINTLPVKSYFATVAFAGDSQYKKSSVKITVTVSKANSKLTAAAKTFKRTDKTKKYIVTLKTDKNAAYKNAKVTIKVNKVTYSAKTNSKGQATFKLTKLTKNGRYSASVKFAGDSKYKASSKSVKIVVK
jgi:predicted ATPase